MKQSEPPVITRSRLINDLKKIGVLPGQIVMLHASVKPIGWIVGGPDMVIRSILDVLTPKGTLMMYIAWEDSTYEFAEWTKEKQQAYLEECPPFDPATSPAYRKWSILTEYLRTWQGAYRSDNPEASVTAVGAKAKWITKDHPLQYGYGPGSPFAKLCEAKGKVLLLGTPLSKITLMHYAEHRAKVPNKRIVRYKVPILSNGKRVWTEIEEFDTGEGIRDWNKGDSFEAIAGEYLESGKGISGKIGAAQSYLFDAADLVEFAILWLERTYGETR